MHEEVLIKHWSWRPLSRLYSIDTWSVVQQPRRLMKKFTCPNWRKCRQRQWHYSPRQPCRPPIIFIWILFHFFFLFIARLLSVLGRNNLANQTTPCHHIACQARLYYITRKSKLKQLLFDISLIERKKWQSRCYLSVNQWDCNF